VEVWIPGSQFINLILNMDAAFLMCGKDCVMYVENCPIKYTERCNLSFFCFENFYQCNEY
jgi:hypothetical protein